MPFLNQILTPERTACSVPGVSKKRLFETIAKIVCADQPSLPYDDVLGKLIAREKLGSTGVGGGIAIPHCRVSSCTAPTGTLLTLAEPIPFDAPDEQSAHAAVLSLAHAGNVKTHTLRAYDSAGMEPLLAGLA